MFALRIIVGSILLADLTGAISSISVRLNYHNATRIMKLTEEGCTVEEKAKNGVNKDFEVELLPLKSMDTNLEEIALLCQYVDEKKINASEFLNGIHTRAFFIFPGTKWCGSGTNAEDFSDLGEYVMTDMCCRAHDYCKLSIKGFSCEESTGLCNYTPFTRSHCDCDQEFRKCLKRTKEQASESIGFLYFNIFGFKCFRKDFPILSCNEWGGFLNFHCQRYTLNYNEARIFQFFDNYRYNPVSRYHANL